MIIISLSYTDEKKKKKSNIYALAIPQIWQQQAELSDAAEMCKPCQPERLIPCRDCTVKFTSQKLLVAFNAPLETQTQPPSCSGSLYCSSCDDGNPVPKKPSGRKKVRKNARRLLTRCAIRSMPMH